MYLTLLCVLACRRGEVIVLEMEKIAKIKKESFNIYNFKKISAVHLKHQNLNQKFETDKCLEMSCVECIFKIHRKICLK